MALCGDCEIDTLNGVLKALHSVHERTPLREHLPLGFFHKQVNYIDSYLLP